MLTAGRAHWRTWWGCSMFSHHLLVPRCRVSPPQRHAHLPLQQHWPLWEAKDSWQVRCIKPDARDEPSCEKEIKKWVRPCLFLQLKDGHFEVLYIYINSMLKSTWLYMMAENTAHHVLWLTNVTGLLWSTPFVHSYILAPDSRAVSQRASCRFNTNEV